MAKKFKPITKDLDKLTETEQLEYVLAVCDFLGVPSELGVVGMRWMDSGDGRRNLVCYVEKGATDIIREKRGICVDSMDETNGPGYVGWKVKGHNAAGRTEIAVGTLSIEGKKGKSAADAVMVAQTKACRRLTLQFAGGGFLDVSELDETTTDVVNSAMSLKQLSEQPTVAPNAAPGTDITQTIPDFTPTPKLKVGDVLVMPDGVPVTVISTNAENPLPAETSKPRKRGRRANVSISEAQPVAKTDPSLQGENGRPQGSEQKPVEAQVVAPTLKSEKPASVKSFDVGGPPNVHPALQVTPEVIVAMAKPAPEKAVPPAPEAPSDKGVVPNEEQERDFKRRLSRYVNDILALEGGFQQSEGITRYDKIGKFFKKKFSKANTKSLSMAQWDEFFTFMDGTYKAQGATALVALIEATIAEPEPEEYEEEEND